jgi:predicted CXXCH cytochrome family protein
VQYLLPAKDGGYHTMSAAWDTGKREWFDIFGDTRSSGDWGHWLGRGMNWNSQCAWCHMSGFSKNYDAQKDLYASSWKEPGVTCIQCHQVSESGPQPKTGCLIDSSNKPDIARIHDNCASCHARREEFDDKFTIGKRFDDHFRLILPVQPGVFWPNGMQRDEDYCETGLRLSRMGKAGVTCLDCHDPHSATLRLPQENNALCMRCHQGGDQVNDISAPIIDPTKHSPCPSTSMGARCVECHMPESPYMARDPRRDHSFNSPDPELSLEIKQPNACSMCHKDKDDAWAAEVTKKFYGTTERRKQERQRARAVQHALDGNSVAVEQLIAVYDAEENETWKATFLELADPWAEDTRLIERARSAMKAETPLLRAAAVRILGRTHPEEVKVALKDPVRAVRIQAEWGLRSELKAQSPEFIELAKSALHEADQPPGAMKLAQLEMTLGNNKEADEWFRKALEWDPTSSVIHRDYAIFLSSQGESARALEQIKQATELDPDDPQGWYLLALGLIETNKSDEALKSFERSLKIAPNFLPARYSRALLLAQEQRYAEAQRDLGICCQSQPRNIEYLSAAATISYYAKDNNAAMHYAVRILEIFPNHKLAKEILKQSTGQRED